jgi:hypothetical protein
VRYLDSEPALGHLRFREIADGESGQRIVRIRFGGVNGLQAELLSVVPPQLADERSFRISRSP